jgi:hypothetical protein
VQRRLRRLGPSHASFRRLAHERRFSPVQPASAAIWGVRDGPSSVQDRQVLTLTIIDCAARLQRSIALALHKNSRELPPTDRMRRPQRNGLPAVSGVRLTAGGVTAATSITIMAGTIASPSVLDQPSRCRALLRPPPVPFAATPPGEPMRRIVRAPNVRRRRVLSFL